MAAVSQSAAERLRQINSDRRAKRDFLTLSVRSCFDPQSPALRTACLNLKGCANTGNSRDGGPFRRGVHAVLCLLLGSIVLGWTLEPATAQTEFPSREITLIVPFAAGGPTDTVARIVSERMARTLGQQIIVENVTGSGGATAAIRASVRHRTATPS